MTQPSQEGESDQVAAPAAELVGRFVRRGSSRALGTLDAVVDELLEDEELLDVVYEAQGKRHPHSRTRGRRQTPAEVALRMLILKQVRSWSYEVLEREGAGRACAGTTGTEQLPRKLGHPF